MKDIPISALSDGNFYEEECEDLRERIKVGSLKRPTVVELEKKAQVLHKDITKHPQWIEREVVLLQKHIDHANEKGWRKQLFEFLERKQLLQTKKEQDRLFSVMPKVVAEELAPDVKTVDALEENIVEQERENSCSPKSTPNEASDISGADQHAIWHYLDPNGIIQGPFTLTMLKHWSEIGCYFKPNFRVWMVGQSPQEAVLLVDLLRQFFPVQ